MLGAGTPGEYQVKAAFLYNFAKFVEWPAANAAAGGNFAICVVGDPAVAKKVEAVVDGKSAAGANVVVRSLSSGGASGDCHIVFVTDESAAAAVRSTANSGVLTVGEVSGFAKAGGMINFVLVGKKIRFEVNKKSAEAAGLSISSHLLKLAHDIYE